MLKAIGTQPRYEGRTASFAPMECRATYQRYRGWFTRRLKVHTQASELGDRLWWFMRRPKAQSPRLRRCVQA